MNRENKKRVDSLMVALPNSVLKFLENNPQLAKVLGLFVVKRQEVVDLLKEADEVLSDPKYFEQFQESGTSEDLANFLETLSKALKEDQVVNFDQLPTEVAEKLLKNAQVKTIVDM